MINMRKSTDEKIAFMTAWTDRMTQVTKYKGVSIKRSREPDLSVLKIFDKKIAAFSKRVEENGENGFRTDYYKSSLKFWQGAKIGRQQEIADYRYQKKNLSKYFKLWNY
jgi:hypothetical protein